MLLVVRRSTNGLSLDNKMNCLKIYMGSEDVKNVVSNEVEYG